MFGLPIEVLSMAGSSVLGGAMKLMGQAQADKAEQQKLLMQRFEASEKSIEEARNYQNPNAAWIRRFIVVMLLLIVTFIVVAPVFFNVPVNVPVEISEGWLFWKETVTKYITLNGIVVPEWLKFAILDIIAFYFGTSAVSRK